MKMKEMKKYPLKPGIPPSQQLREANALRDSALLPRLTYLPHIGAKQKAKQLARLAKKRPE